MQNICPHCLQEVATVRRSYDDTTLVLATHWRHNGSELWSVCEGSRMSALPEDNDDVYADSIASNEHAIASNPDLA